MCLSHAINGATRRHTASETTHTRPEIGDRALGPVGDDSDTVARVHECTFAQDHIPVTIAIACSTKV